MEQWRTSLTKNLRTSKQKERRESRKVLEHLPLNHKRQSDRVAQTRLAHISDHCDERCRCWPPLQLQEARLANGCIQITLTACRRAWCSTLRFGASIPNSFLYDFSHGLVASTRRLPMAFDADWEEVNCHILHTLSPESSFHFLVWWGNSLELKVVIASMSNIMLISTLLGRAPAASTACPASTTNSRPDSCIRWLPGAALDWQ